MIRGLLLGGGEGTRFGGAKLLAATPLDPVPIGVRAARSLVAGAGNALAVVRAGDAALAQALREAGCEVLESADCARGLGASLAAGVKASADASGWIVALADMPRILPATHRAVAGALARGAKLAVAVDPEGRRGHPVGFASDFFADLAALDGDTGARGVIERHRAWLEVVRVDDPGIHLDIDTPGDLAAG
ncbi:MAG: NTP transferase domain-containing protein [Burkholderiales bacterium]